MIVGSKTDLRITVKLLIFLLITSYELRILR